MPQVGCITPTSLTNWSLFTTSEDSTMGEHKTIQFGGSTEREGWRSREQVNVTTNRLASQIYANLKSRWGGRMWQFNKGVCMISHITLQWWSYLMRWRWIVTCDSNYACLWLRSSITKVCWVGFEWFQELRIFEYVNRILKTSIDKFPINFIFGKSVCKITSACVKLFNGFIECFS